MFAVANIVPFIFIFVSLSILAFLNVKKAVDVIFTLGILIEAKCALDKSNSVRLDKSLLQNVLSAVEISFVSDIASDANIASFMFKLTKPDKLAPSKVSLAEELVFR
jgi:hypothetical protein